MTQLIVDNARYALNAANARWGSLYNALYGTDVIPGKVGKSWDKERAFKVINFVRDFLDERIPLVQISWQNVSKFNIEENNLIIINDLLLFQVDENFLRNNYYLISL